MKDDMLRRYLRYLSYAEELRTIAADRKNSQESDVMATIADEYDQMAVSLNSILRSKAALET